MKKNIILVIVYLVAIIAANLLTTCFGPEISVLNSFLFIGLDITTRDILHESWKKFRLLNMMLLILVGSILSYLLNQNSYWIATASSAAFLLAGFVDYITYSLLYDKTRLIKINGSNIISSLVDSIIFPTIAFGVPLMWGIIIGQFIVKILGGFLWSLVIKNDVYVTTE